MNSTSLILLTGVLATGVSASVAVVMNDGTVAAPEPALAPELTAGVAHTLEALQAEQAKIADAVERLEMQIAGVETGGARVSVGDIEAAVERYMEQSDASEVALAEAPRAEAEWDKEEVFARLLADDEYDGDVQELWQKIRDDGRMDEVLAMFVDRAEADPNNPEKQVELGTAYLQKIQEVGNGPLAGVYATKADQSFDAALAVDDHHWSARFNKAVALSFWPPIFGKQTAAIQEFEVLVAQQQTQTQSPRHSQTHLLLGNMYQQLGEPAKAVAAWKTGLALFPNDEGLQQQLALVGD